MSHVVNSRSQYLTDKTASEAVLMSSIIMSTLLHGLSQRTTYSTSCDCVTGVNMFDIFGDISVDQRTEVAVW